MKLEERKLQIMSAALELFAHQGYYNTSVADIIREIGTARGTFYRYFVDKQDLFNFIVNENLNYAVKLLPHLPYEQFLSLEEIEARIVKGFRAFLDLPTSRNFIRLIVETMGSEKKLEDMVANAREFFVQGFKTYFLIIQGKGLLANRDPEIIAFFLLALIKETFVHWALYNEFDDLEKLVHEMVTFIAKGLFGTPKQT